MVAEWASGGRVASQPVHGVRLLYDQRVPMRDGITLSADVYLPRAPGPFPAILFRTPYESTAPRFIKWGIYWAERGYAAVIEDCRGKYESEGTFYAYVHDGEDAYDTVDWVANQPWCDGKVGTWGRSYGGLTQWLLAPLGNPNLACMAPHVIMDDYFKDYHYVGGAFQLNLSITGAIIFHTCVPLSQAGSERLFQNRRFLRQLPLIDMDIHAIGRRIPHWRDWLEHDRYDAYWQRLTTLGRYDRIDVPIFQQCGWFDAYPGATLRQWVAMTREGKSERARRNQRVLMGPWSHAIPESSRMGEVDFGPPGYVDVWQEEVRWYDHWLKGIDTGLMDEPPLRLFVMGVNEWRRERAWPLPDTRFTPWYLHSNGHANTYYGDGTLSEEPPGAEPPDRFDYDPENPVPTLGGNNSTAMNTEYAEEPIVPGPVDQRTVERRDDVLVYTSRELEQDVEVTGPVELMLYVASSARDTDFTVKLVDVYPGGRALNLSEGIIRARYRLSDTDPELLEPGEVQVYRIQLYPTANVFRRGHRIRIDISSSNFPRFARNLNTGEAVATGTRMQIARQTVLHSGQYPSHIVLPIVPT